MAKEKKEEESIIPVQPPVAMPTSYTKFENGKQEIVNTENEEAIPAGATTASTTAAAKAAAKAEAKAEAEAQEEADKLAADAAK